MSGILDGLLVGAVLAVSAFYVCISMGPKALRRRLLCVLAAVVAHAPSWLGLRRTAERLSAAGTNNAGGSCGGCDSCAAEPPASASVGAGSDGAPKTTASGLAPTPREIRVPLAKIGRRTNT